MSEEAIRILEDGSEEIVQATKLEKEDKAYCYLCNGRDDNGTPCRVTVKLVVNEKSNYFSVKGGKQHISGCSCDKAREARVISTLNRLGKSLTPEALYAAFDRDTRCPRGGGGKRGGGGSGGGTEPGEQKIDHRPIMRVFSDPRSLRLLIKLLMSKEREEVYGSMPVNEWLLDRYGVVSARENGILSGTLRVAFAVKTARWKEFNLPLEEDPAKKCLVLVDAYSYEQGKGNDAIFYIVEMSKEMADKILEKDPAEHIFAIFSHWYPYGAENNVYLSDRVSGGHIAIFRRKELP